MKRHYFVGALSLAIVAVSCNKQKDISTKQITIDIALAAGTTYSLDLKQYGNSARITKQATAAASSGIDAATLVYKYTSLAKTSAMDQVVLGVASAKTGNNNCRHGADSTAITVNVSVK